MNDDDDVLFLTLIGFLVHVSSDFFGTALRVELYYTSFTESRIVMSEENHHGRSTMQVVIMMTSSDRALPALKNVTKFAS